LLAKTAVRHLDVANGAIGSRHAGNYAEEFAALGGKP
jgi:hypothetical protein